MACLKNNLFNYATSELSQDAFICWLASHALVDCDGNYISSDDVLRECALQMLVMFVPEFKGKKFDLLSVERQVKKTDVLLTVICEGKKYAVIVEDKTYTSEHSNQLLTYKDEIEVMFKEQKETVEIKGVYYKTWYQSDLQNVLDANYLVVLREDVLKLMEPYYHKTNNAIFRDYYDYWNATHMDCLNYVCLPTREWNDKQIYAFYDYLKENFFKNKGMYAGYGYVANPNGGFHGLWTELPRQDEFVVDGIKSQLYLQIHATMVEKDCCEMMVALRLNIRGSKSSDDNRHVRNQIAYDTSKWEYDLEKYNFIKPLRFGNGVTMTIGEYKGHSHNFESYKDFEKLISEAVCDYEKLLEDVKRRYS